MKKLIMTISFTAIIYGSDSLHPNKRLKVDTPKEEADVAPLEMKLTADSSIARSSAVFQHIAACCAPSQESVRVSMFTEEERKNLEGVLDGTVEVKNLSCTRLLGVLKLRDFLNIPSAMCPIEDAFSIRNLRTIVHDKGLVDDFKAAIIRSVLLNHQRAYLFKEGLIFYEPIEHLPRDIVIQTKHYAQANHVSAYLEGNICQITDKENNIHSLQHTDIVSLVAMSADGRYVARASFDNKVRVYDLQENQEIATIKRKKRITSMAMAPDGRYVVTGSGDDRAQIYDVYEQKVVAIIKHAACVNAVAISANGHVVTGSDDRTAKVYNLQTQQLINIQHVQAVNAVAISADGGYLVIASKNYTGLCNMATMCSVGTMHHQAVSPAVAISADGRHVLTGSWDATATIYDVEEGQEIATVVHQNYWASAAVSADGQYLLFGKEAYVLNADQLKQASCVELTELCKQIFKRTRA